jgi:hypothetical protein
VSGFESSLRHPLLPGPTALGRLLLDLHPIFTASEDRGLRWIGIRLLVPATQAHRLPGGGKHAETR